MKCSPPKYALRFLRWFCREDYLDEIEGDLVELFENRYEQSPAKAARRFWWDVMKSFRIKNIKQFKGQNSNYTAMFKHYFKVSWRNLVRNKGYSFINVGGLSAGIAVAMLIGLWVYDEVSFNRYYDNYERIGQIWAGGTDPTTSAVDGSFAMQYPAASALRDNYGDYFKQALLAWWISDYTLTEGNQKFIRKGEFIERGALDMLSLKMLRGTHGSLGDPHSIVLSKSTADAIFGALDPVGKTLSIDNKMTVQVTGVYADIPRNNHFSEVQFFAPLELFVSSNPWMKRLESNWDNRSFNIYVQLHRGITLESANDEIHDFYYRNLPEDLIKLDEKYKPFAQVVPMSKWHLYNEFENGKPAGGRITFVWLFAVAGFFVLLLACINFVNLSTARSAKRAKETGIRKAIGSARSQLVGQFLSESLMVVLFAFIFSALLVALLLPEFNQLTDKDVSIPFTNPVFWSIVIAFLAVTGLLAGLYPAFYLSAFRPAKVLKGAMSSGRFAGLPRQILVTFQFSVSVVLIIGTVVVYQQIQYAQNRPVGYNKESLISMRMTDPNFQGKQDVLRNELFNTGLVEEIAFASNPLTMVWHNSGGFDWRGKDPDIDSDFAFCYVSASYGSTVKWQIVEGRNFDRNLASDSAAVIINEAAAKYMNLENPLGETITNESGEKMKIVGVVKDVIMGSPYEPVKQTIFQRNSYVFSNIIVRLNGKSGSHESLSEIEKVFAQVVPTAAFDYSFADEAYDRKFAQEVRISKLASAFAVLAILISCLGLFGLASYVAEQRTKEIGIRKVLGASVASVWRLLSKDFIVLVTISFVVSMPVGYYLTTRWLEKYNYRTGISWQVFVITGAAALLITLLTVSYQAIRAASANPVKSLRTE